MVLELIALPYLIPFGCFVLARYNPSEHIYISLVKTTSPVNCQGPGLRYTVSGK